MEAAELAFPYADRIYTARETKGVFRFRQRPPSCFVKGTIWTQTINDRVSVIMGRLKKGMEKKRGCKLRRRRKGK